MSTPGNAAGRNTGMSNTATSNTATTRQSSREAILGGIRSALAVPARADGHVHHEAGSTEYQRAGTLAPEERIALFAHRLRDYDAELQHCASPAEVPAAILSVLAPRVGPGGRLRIAVPSGFPAELMPAMTPLPEGSLEWLIDDPPLSNAELDGADGVLTRATVAVAISGSIALQHGPAEGRRVLTLLPDFHLCVLGESELVETLPEALARLHPTASRPTTFFSGPSATADIEMTRIKGVHGPRFLAVLLVAGL